MPLRRHPDAEDEVWLIGVGLAVHGMGRAIRFDRVFNAALSRIAADPTSHPLHHMAAGPQVRYVPIAGFPYLVLFRPYLVLFRTTDPAETVVIGVLHTGAGPAAFRRAERRG